MDGIWYIMAKASMSAGFGKEGGAVSPNKAEPHPEILQRRRGGEIVSFARRSVTMGMFDYGKTISIPARISRPVGGASACSPDPH